ncbi:hypothetical protein YPPY54_0411, partial [Yersinia pestis PY-54]
GYLKQKIILPIKNSLGHTRLLRAISQMQSSWLGNRQS